MNQKSNLKSSHPFHDIQKSFKVSDLDVDLFSLNVKLPGLYTQQEEKFEYIIFN